MPEDQKPYDSRADTLKHIAAVQKLLKNFIGSLSLRSLNHDQSKLEEPEKPYFDEFTPKLKGTTYGSDEYYQYMDEMKPGLDHHYAACRHHPEHHPNGISDMNLSDLVEMFCDWMAAVQRHDDGDIHRSIDQNEERFAYSSQLRRIFHNTACVLLGHSMEQRGPESNEWVRNPDGSDTRKFSAECFADGMRLLPKTMTKEEALDCRMAALHMIGQLTGIHGLRTLSIQ